MVPDLNPGHFIISQLADLIGDHLIAGAMVMTQISPEQLPSIPKSFLGLSEGFSFYEMKSGHIVSLSHILYMGMASQNFKGSDRIPDMLWTHRLSL